MSFIKENLLIIILVILIIMIAIAISIFVDIIKNSNMVNDDVNENVVNNNEQQLEEKIVNEDNIININMSKYYLNTDYGRVAEIYNKMLDELGKSKYIFITSNGSDYTTKIDLNKMCLLQENSNSYYCLAYNDKTKKAYKYANYVSGIEQSMEDFLWMKSNADFVAFAVIFSIMYEDYKWDYKYNENVSRNGYLCYEIIANSNGDFYNPYGEKERYDGTYKLYIDMETYKLIEKESTTYISDKIGYITYSDFYEYSNDDLKIPKEAEEYIYNY